MSSKPRVLVLPTSALYRDLFTPETDEQLRSIADVTFNESDTNLNSEQLAQKIPDYDVVITGWGSPPFIDDVLSAANRLRLIAHSAGSIKRMLPPNVFKKGIAVTHAATAIAPAVAEMTVLLILLCLRQAHKLDRILKDGGDWRGTKVLGMGQELAGARVGVVGAGHTGREVIWRLNALKADVWASDPYMSPERAKELGVTKVEMDDIFRDCPIVTMQAPPTEETYRMVGAKQLGLLRDGAIFVNTARSHTVDQDALLAELRTGRFQAALDVFDQEPLPTYSPFRQLDNVFITPHVAGASTQARLRQGELMVQELKSFFEDETLKWEVTLDMLDTMA